MTSSTSRPVLALFVVLAALQTVPIWSVTHVPTGDGPTHVYNAWVLHGLATGSAPPHIEAAYRIDWRPHPNWTGHALMALFMTAVPPRVAEKLLLTVILALMAAGAWLLVTAVDPRNDVYAFLVFPFTYIQTFVAGYYNYSLSIGLFLIILATWWRRRDARGLATVAIEAALLLLCYFTHPQATLLAAASIAFLSLFTKRFFHLAALIPVAPLLILFGRSEEANTAAPIAGGIDWFAAEILAGIQVMQSLGDAQYPLSTIVALVFAALIVLTLVRERRREADLLAILALIFAAMMFWLPAAAGTRALFLQRNSVFVFLTLAAWFTPRVPRKTVLALLTAIALANAAIHLDWFRRLGRDLTAWTRTFDVIEPGSSILPLYFSPAPSPSIVDVYLHAMSYVALEKQLVDHSNYEPATHYFPIASKIEAIDAAQVEQNPAAVDIARAAPHARYVITRGLAEDSSLRASIENLYNLLQEAGDLRVYHRKTALTDHDLILLPLLGTTHDVGAPHGARWRVEQRIVNRGATPAHVIFRNCLAAMPCELVVRDAAPIASSEKFAFLHVPRTAKLDVTTTVRRVDTNLAFTIPAPHEREFVGGTARLENLDTGAKLGLRLYLISEKAWSVVAVRLRSRETGWVIAERTVDVAGYGLFDNANLASDFPGFETKAKSVDIEIEAPPDARVWAFATEANDAGETRVVVTSRSSAPARATAPPSPPAPR